MASRLLLSSLRRSPLAPYAAGVHAPGVRRHYYGVYVAYSIDGDKPGTVLFPYFAFSALLVYETYVHHSLWVRFREEEAKLSKIIEANNLKIETLKAKGKPDANGIPI